jgi:hypothetical protein
VLTIHLVSLAALAQNLETISVCRFIVGCAGYTGSTMVGGTLADIWKTYEYVESSFLFIIWLQMS